MLNLSEHPINAERKESQEFEGQHVGRAGQRGLWITLTVLFCALIAAAAYGYRTLRDARIEIARLPEMVKSLTDLHKRLAAAETAIAAWTSDRQALGDRVAGLERRVKSNLQQARQHADSVTAQLEARIEDELEERNAEVDARIAKVEADQGEQHAQLARLQNQLARAQQEIASLRQTTDHDLAGVRQHLEGSDRAVETIAQRLDTRRVSFEAARKHETEIISTVALNVHNTDVRHQRYSGWIHILPESRFLWVSEQGIQQPVVFYRLGDGTKFDLVVTRVASNSVVGYLQMPSEPPGGTTTRPAQAGALSPIPLPAGQAGQ